MELNTKIQWLLKFVFNLKIDFKKILSEVRIKNF